MPAGMITSPTNPRVRALAALRRRRGRHGADVILVEGYAELRLAVAAGVRPRTAYVSPALTGDAPAARALVADLVAAGAELVELSRPVFEKVAYRESPDGWLAEVPPVTAALDALTPAPGGLLLVVEAVEKPGNLGAMLRTADAAGVAAVVAADPVTDWANPNVVRASKGTVFTVPVAEATTAATIAWLRARGTRIVVTTPEAAVLHTEADLTGDVAVVVGSESDGAGPAWLAAADVRVRIPMAGRIDSLNVATAAAVVLYEAVRQRTAARGGGVRSRPAG